MEGRWLLEGGGNGGDMEGDIVNTCGKFGVQVVKMDSDKKHMRPLVRRKTKTSSLLMDMLPGGTFRTFQRNHIMFSQDVNHTFFL